MPWLMHLPLCCTECAAQIGYRGALLRGMLFACSFDNLNSFEVKNSSPSFFAVTSKLYNYFYPKLYNLHGSN